MGTRRSSDSTWLWVVPLALILPAALGWSARNLAAQDAAGPAVVVEGVTVDLPDETPPLRPDARPARLAAAASTADPRR